MEDARKGQFDVVVVDKIDRFYRHLGGLLITLDQMNALIVSFAPCTRSWISPPIGAS
jgi:DNA invertase Pin-like site-specific DNA recombinase